jgi:redox-sensitive bicupin YhaK (pirin superfamily)
MPKGDAEGAMHGFQLWANLPAANKMMEPRYRGITSAEIPEVTDAGGAKVKIIAGDMERDRLIGDGHLVSFEDGDAAEPELP